jgi:hypothetical protein
LHLNTSDMAKHKFRKVYFVCRDNKIMPQSQGSFTSAFSTESHAVEQEQFHNKKELDNAKQMWNEGKQMPVHKAHGFYLVHESLYEKILKQWAEDGQ